MHDNCDGLKFYVWCGRRKLVVLANSPLEAARLLIRRAMDDDAIDELEPVIHVSMMGFDASLFRFDFKQVLLSIQTRLD